MSKLATSPLADLMPYAILTRGEIVKPKVMGISGSRDVRYVEERKIIEAMEAIRKEGYNRIAHGCCVGADRVAAEAAFHMGLSVHGVLPSDHSRVFHYWRDICDSWEQMDSSTSYLDRNQRIVDISDALTAFPLYPEHHKDSRRSGTWATIRRAQQKGIPVTIHLLRG